MNTAEHLHDKQYRIMALALTRLMREPGLTWRDRVEINDTLMMIRMQRDELLQEAGRFGEAGAIQTPPSPPSPSRVTVGKWLPAGEAGSWI